MLTTIGTILNWLAVGILYPVLLMPLANLLSARYNKLSQIITWIMLTILLAWGGILFMYLIPGQSGALFPSSFAIWAIAMLGFSVLVFFTGGLRIWIEKINHLASRICTLTGRGVMWLIFVMALVQFTVVILRYVFGVSFIWMQESITYMHGAVFLLAAGYALLTDDHVRVDLFYRYASEKRKALVNFFGTYLLLIPVCFLLLWAASPYVYASWEATEGSNESSGLQLLYLLKSLIPAFAIMLLLAGFVVITDAANILRSTVKVEKS